MERETITWTVKRVRLGELKPWQRNPRRMSEEHARRLLDSWEEFGQVQTIAVSPDLEVYDGHQRLSALLSAYGPDYEVVVLQSSRDLTDDERRRLVIMLHAGTMGEWDWEELATWDIDLLTESGFDRELTDALRRDVLAIEDMLRPLQKTPEFASVTSREYAVEDVGEPDALGATRERQDDDMLELVCPHCGQTFRIRRQ